MDFYPIGILFFLPIFNTEILYSKVEISSKCIEITSLIVINPFVVLFTRIYPSPSIKPRKNAKNEGGRERYSDLSILMVFSLFLMHVY